ncbi:hypothetical protein [Bacillus sp. FJAT-45350]|uniref:hypothetical protein n=1 Tax=Bacillus sp. FJAT-45350 TaxID=2011014 RepID=UPI000BB7F06A|nr:hypothetical protein [Bacillus sp. FJAT-45350]
MRRSGPYTKIGSIRINNARGGSINFGPTIHKGHQANSKFVTGEYIIGDEFTFNFGPVIEENGENNNIKEKLKSMINQELEEKEEKEEDDILVEENNSINIEFNQNK